MSEVIVTFKLSAEDYMLTVSWEEWNKLMSELREPFFNGAKALALYSKLSLWERLKFKLLGYVKVFRVKTPSGVIDFYLVKCNQCGLYFLDYPHGYKQYFLCPKCSKEGE